jgi:dimethylsulfone monooxygenase
VQESVAAFAAAGVDLLLLQFSPQLEEMELFAKAIIPPAGDASVEVAS